MKILNKTISAGLAVMMIISSGVTAFASDSTSKEEVIYVMTDASGSTESVYAVNIYKDVSAAVVSEVRRVCENYLGFLDTEKLTEKAQKQLQAELRKQGRDITALKTKLESIRMKIDSSYEDKLSGNIDNHIFQRIYAKLREEENATRTKLTELEKSKKDNPSINEDKIKELVKRFIDSEDYTRQLFVSLIERIELSESKELDIHFKFPELKIADRL